MKLLQYFMSFLELFERQIEIFYIADSYKINADFCWKTMVADFKQIKL